MSHIDQALDLLQRQEAIDEAVLVLGKIQDQFDTIVFRGMSGALIAPPVADILGKPMILIRKENDDTHSHLTIEGRTGYCDIVNRYVIVDDFVSSGATVKKIIETIKAAWLNKLLTGGEPVLVGLFQYHTCRTRNINQYLPDVTQLDNGTRERVTQ